MTYYTISLEFAAGREKYEYAGYDGGELRYGPRKDSWGTFDKQEAVAEAEMIERIESEHEVKATVIELEIED